MMRAKVSYRGYITGAGLVGLFPPQSVSRHEDQHLCLAGLVGLFPPQSMSRHEDQHLDVIWDVTSWRTSYGGAGLVGLFLLCS